MICKFYAGNDDYAQSSAEYELTVTSSAPVTEETFTFANLGYENAQSVTTVNGSACTLLFNDGTNTQNDPRYYTTGSGVRMYKDNTLTISSTTKTIGSIEFTFDGNYTALLLESNQPGELSDVSNSKRTWTGNANSVQFTTSAANRIQAITITYVTTEMGETTLQLSDVNTPYGTDATVDATVPEGYDDGKLAAESSNISIATASVSGTTITITPVAVGTTTITVTAPATDTFSEPATGTINVTVTAPKGKTTTAAFNETFDNSTGTAGWSGNFASGTLAFDNKGWLSYKGNGNGGSARFGTSSEQGYAITPALGKAGNLTLSFKAGAWEGDKTTGGLILSIEEGEGTLGTSTFTLEDSHWGSYETTITGATAATKIKFSAAQKNNNRFFLDDVVVTKQGVALTATLNDFGYATYCSEYPLNFSTDNGYSAWQVTGVGDEAITFEKVTGSVKGGTGLLLMGKPSDTVTLTSENSKTVLTNNKLEGTLAPTFVEDNKYYGLSGKQFLKVNRGTVPAGKALLPVVDNVGNVRTLSLVFVDPTTGIAETKTMTNEDAIYNLAGQRISKAQRGVNIVGGKKVLVK